MNREEFEELAAMLIKGEETDQDRQRLEDWLEQHPEDRTELEELKRTYAFLGELDECPVPEIPLTASQVVSMTPPGRPWIPWAAAAAACIAFCLLCVSQGLSIQVGTVRVAFGAAADIEEIQKQIADTMAAAELVSDRQNRLEDSLHTLVSLREADLSLSRREIRQFATELARALDERVGELYTVAYTGPEPATQKD